LTPLGRILKVAQWGRIGAKSDVYDCTVGRRVQPVSRDEWNGPGFRYVVRWRRRSEHDARGNSSGHSEFEERQVAANTTSLVLGGRPVFTPYDVYVVSVNDIGPAVAAPQLVTVYTGENPSLSLLIPEKTPVCHCLHR